MLAATAHTTEVSEHNGKLRVSDDIGFRDPATLERFELWGACGDLNLPSLPTHDPS